jgi:lysine 2,3-aminomutase
MNVHFEHPAEITEEAGVPARCLQDARDTSGNQSVILKGVNDDPHDYEGAFPQAALDK